MIVLQNIVFPDPAISDNPALYVHLDSGGELQMAGGLCLQKGMQAGFDTYFNLLNLGKWRGAAELDGLFLVLRLRGRVAIKILHAVSGAAPEVLRNETLSFAAGTDHVIDLSQLLYRDDLGVIWFTLTAQEDEVAFSGGRFWTGRVPATLPQLALSITTFCREEAVKETVARIGRFLQKSAFCEHIRLFVIDNGDSAMIDETPHVRRIANANLGGAGGFARGLLEAEAAGFSHVLFMDDDASIHMEAIHRAYALLALSADPALAVAGAMVTSREPWRMWENGALFNGNCVRLFPGVDLRDPAEVIAMELASTRPAPDTFYGGWWFFAFPVAAVERYPFPFFVRGDDVNFSLANPFKIVTLNGIVSRAEDFTDKESPLNWYLDLRSHMVHHLTLPHLDRGAFGVARIGVWFFLRNLVRFQYESIEAVLLGWEDVLRGPGFFAAQGDMAERRARLKALTRTEAWKPLSQLDPGEPAPVGGPARWARHIFRLTGNGHLLPFFRAWGARVTVPPEGRGSYRPIWGAAEITYLNATRDMGYTVRQSKRRFFAVSLRLALILVRFLSRYRALRAAYRTAYPALTSAGFWREKLGVG